MSSVAKEVQFSFIGITPNPVNASSTYLIQVGVSEVMHTWNDWASNTWQQLGAMMWGEQ